MKSKDDYELSSGNVFKDVGLPNPEQELLRAQLAYLVYKAIRDKRLTQEKAALLLGVTQPDISKLKHGQFVRFTVERLIRFLTCLQLNVKIQISKSKNHEGHISIASL
jgi:predicted XRE-type DNA-binding protein